MKMNRFTVKITGLVLALSFLFVISACSDIDSGEAPGNGTYLVLAPNGVSFDARSVEPDEKYIVANFTNITLTATKSGGTKQTLASSIGNLEALYAKQFLLEGGAGSYSLELNGTLDKVIFSQLLENVVIEESTTNAISFTLVPTGSKDTNDFGDNGGISVTLKFNKTNVSSIHATLLNLDENTITEEKTITSGYFSSGVYTYKKNASYINVKDYYTSLYTEGSVTPGNYRLTFDFLTDNKLLINSFSYIVHVVKGLNSMLTQEIDLNQIYSITYTKNGGSLAEGEVEIAKYTRLNEVILPRLTRDNYTFIGWYDNSSFEGEPVTKIEKGSTENKTFYARFVSSALYVNAVNGDDSHDGSSGSSTKALQTLGAALNKMALTADGKKLDYTIYLTGTFTGEQTIADPSDSALPAASITLAGYSGVDSVTGEPKDVLDGNFGDDECGSTLSVETTVPVIIKNLKITGGKATSDETNGRRQGGGIYVSSGKVTASSGLLITGNTAVSGGGVYIAPGATFEMTGGMISGNETTKGDDGMPGPGSGVYVALNDRTIPKKYGTFIMSGSAVVESNNEVYLTIGTHITVGGSLSGANPVAKITPSSLGNGTQVLALAEDSGTTPAAEFGKFSLGSEIWGIDADGEVKYLPKEIYVAAIALDAVVDGTQENPVGSIDSAVNLMCDPDADYTIYVSGVLNSLDEDNNIVPYGYDISGEIAAKSITLTGATAPDGEGIPQDVIDCGASQGDDSYTTLTIRTEVPVTITNLKITNGGTNLIVGGVNSGSPVNADVTLGENALITGTVSDNDGYPNGHGVLVSSGKFTLAGGSIKDNDGNVGGGVKVEAGKFIMTGGEISGNSSASYGGGVYIAAGAEFMMTGGNLSENYVADGDFGGAVYVEAESSFKLGGSLAIPAGDDNKNDIYLCYPSCINITGDLDGDFAAVITPDKYVEGNSILAKEGSVEFQAECQCFTITPQTTDGNGQALTEAKVWYLTKDGKLTETAPTD